MASIKLSHSHNEAPSGPHIRAALLALAAAMLGMALQIGDGLYAPTGIGLITLALPLCALAVLAPAALNQLDIPLKKLNTFIGVLVAVQFLAILPARAGASAATVPQTDLLFLRICVLVAVGGLAMILFTRMTIARLGFTLMLAIFVAIGVWKIRTAPSPKIDVFVFHRDGAEALSHGENPYTITFPDIYGPAGDYVYGPGIVRDGRLQFGYPYPPLVLLLTAAADRSLGDARYAMLAAMLAAGVMIAAIAPGRVGMLAAALLLFTPRSFYVLEQAWTEPLSVMFLTATVLFAQRAFSPSPRRGEGWGEGGMLQHGKPDDADALAPHPDPLPSRGEGEKPTSRLMFWLAATFFGLFIASKQYLPAAVVLAPILIPNRRNLLRFLAIAGLVAAAVTLPLALWNWKAFWYSVFELQTHQPYRPDSLSYLAWWGFRKTGWQGPFWLCFVAMGLAMAACWYRTVRNFVGAFALCFFAFFAFNKQAFANYYYLILGALSCAIAVENCTQTAASADKTLSDHADLPRPDLDDAPHDAPRGAAG